MILQKYKERVDLLLQVLPFVAREEMFALKGGTAINLFVRDMPRLSVDIDLHYTPIKSRKDTLQEIEEGLNRIKADLEKYIKGINVRPGQPDGADTDLKLNCQLHRAQIKVEVNSITRGIIEPVRMLQVNEKVQDAFGKFAAINVVSHVELFGGKILAALDRQHPRDLFDIKLLMDKEGIDKSLRPGFLTMLLCHYKPIHELLNPELKDQQSAFEKQFVGMTEVPFTYEDYENTRGNLISTIPELISEKDRDFLISFVEGSPEWELCDIKALKDLPAVKWRLLNIERLKKENMEKHNKMIEELKTLF
jgi:predicted nucleotidyltransferase component of viral defense system